MMHSKSIHTKTTHVTKAKRHTRSDQQDTSNYTHTLNELALLTLDENGIIKECNKAGADLLGCAASKLTWLNISRFLPRLGEVALLQGERVNPYLRFLSRVGHQFELIGMSGTHFTSQLFFNEAENLSPHCLRIIIQPIGPETALS
jgi:PAS domain-containing protein